MPILIPILQGLRLFDSLPTARLAEVAAVMSERRVERRDVTGQTRRAGEVAGGLRKLND